MDRSRKTVICGLVLMSVLACSSAVWAREPVAVQALSDFKPEQGVNELHRLLTNAEQSLQSLDEDAIRSLLVIVEEEQRPLELRTGIWALLCRRATAVQADQLLGHFSRWFATGESRLPKARMQLVGVTIAAAERPDFASSAVKSEAFRDALMATLARSQHVMPDDVERAETLLVALPLSAEVRSEWAKRALIACGQQMEVRQALADLLDEHAVRELCEQASRALASGDKAPYAVIGALAHRGEACIADIVSKLQKQAKTSATGQPFASRMFAEYAWMLSVQSKGPESMLEELRRPVSDSSQLRDRMWLLQRISKKGVAGSDIRTAVLAAITATRDQSSSLGGGAARKPEVERLAARFKAEAQKLDVLSPEDLPELAVPAEDAQEK